MTALLGIALYEIYAAIVVLGNRPRLRWEPVSKKSALILRLIVIFLIAANWAYLILREKVLIGGAAVSFGSQQYCCSLAKPILKRQK